MNNSLRQNLKNFQIIPIPDLLHRFSFFLILIGFAAVSAWAADFKNTKQFDSKKTLIQKNKLKLERQVNFVLATGDAERIEKLQVISLLKIYDLIRTNYYRVVINQGDWNTAAAIYEELAIRATQSYYINTNQLLRDSFHLEESYYRQLVSICKDLELLTRTGKLSALGSQALFYLVADEKNKTRTIIHNDSGEFIQPWIQKIRAVQDSRSKIDNVNYQIQTKYDFKINAGLENYIKKPVDEFGSEEAYLYQTYLKESNVGMIYRIQYENDFIKWGSLVAQNVLNITVQEASILWENGFKQRLKLDKFAPYLLNDLVSCLDQKNKNNRNDFFKDSITLHQTILGKVKGNTEKLEMLTDFIKTQLSETQMRGLTDEGQPVDIFQEEAQEILKFSQDNLVQRKQITDYVIKNLNFTQNAYDNAISGKMNLNENPVSDFLKFKNKIQELGKKGYITVGPCGFMSWYKKFNKYSEMAGDSLSNNKIPLPSTPTPKQTPVKPVITSQTFQVEIPIKDTIYAKNGEKFEFTADGVIKLGAFVGDSTPSGIDSWNQFRAVEEYKIGSLLVRFKLNENDGWYDCGSSCVLTADQDGIIQLVVNDSYRGDNIGTYTVRIRKIQ